MSIESEENQTASNAILFDKEAQKFVERVGLWFDSYGIARLVGRIVGLLMITNKPLNTDEIMAALGASRTAVSTNLKLGITYDFIEPSTWREAGDRRDYYQFSSDGYQRGLQLKIQTLGELRDLTVEALTYIQPENREARRHLLEMIALYGLTEEWVAALTKEWEKRKADIQVD